jgi:Tfp pilus assembly PilM family ATPase
MLRQAAVRIRILDVEPLALMNAALCLTELEPGELLVALTVGRRRSVLCLFSEQGPVVARYLDAGAEQITGRLRQTFGLSADAALSLAARLSAADLPRAEEACLETLGTMAEAIHLSLAFYRSEYDREALPRYTLGGWVGLPPLGRWLAERLALDAPFEIMDPLQALPATTRTGGREAPTGATPPGSEFLLAFGLALRGL